MRAPPTEPPPEEGEGLLALLAAAALPLASPPPAAGEAGWGSAESSMTNTSALPAVPRQVFSAQNGPRGGFASESFKNETKPPRGTEFLNSTGFAARRTLATGPAGPEPRWGSAHPIGLPAAVRLDSVPCEEFLEFRMGQRGRG